MAERISDLDPDRKAKLDLLKERFGLFEVLRMLRAHGYLPYSGANLGEAVDEVYRMAELHYRKQ